MSEDVDFVLPLGKADVKKEGRDATVISYGRMAPMVLDVADELEEDGIHVEVIDPRTLVPLDRGTIIQSVIKTGRALVVHEAVKTGGFGGEIVSTLVESDAFYH